MMLAPALKASRASAAICAGVTGTGCCCGLVSTPVSAQVRMALSALAHDLQFHQHGARGHRVLGLHVHGAHRAGGAGVQPHLHLHRFHAHQRLAGGHRVARRHRHLGHHAGHRGAGAARGRRASCAG
jgi:hypothetical protein